MNFNYSYEKKKFEQEWAKLEKEYREAGMSDKDIQTMKEFDMEYFRLNRNTVLHTCDLQDNEDLEDNGNDDFGNIDFSKIEYATINEQEKVETHSKFWWIEELNSEKMISKIKILSENDIELITLYVFEKFTQNEIAEFYGISQRAVGKRLAKIMNFLKK